MKDDFAAEINRELNDLHQGLYELHISYSDAALTVFREYLKLLYQYRGKIHLISAGDYQYIARRHCLTALVAYPHVTDVQTVCDVGPGAGFPSIPLAIMYPDKDFTLIESKNKIVGFLRKVIDTLSLNNTTVIHARAEEYSGIPFELVLLKAVGKLAPVLKMVDILVADKGQAVFFKSHDIEEEIAAAGSVAKARGYQIAVEKTWTPIEHRPLALVICTKRRRDEPLDRFGTLNFIIE